MPADPVEAVPGACCWAISDGAAGNDRQALALARALDLEPRVVHVRLRQPWDALAPHLAIGARSTIRVEGQKVAPPWPDIAIGCGRRAALLTRLLREWNGRRTFTVQILDPRIDTAAFDVVIAPAHDAVRGANVIHSLGALNPVDAGWLAAGRTRFAAIGELPAPRCAVLIGASHRAQRLDRAWSDGLLAKLAQRHDKTGGSFLVSTSRRTPPDLAGHLRGAFARWPGVFWSGDTDGENPYSGLLGWADAIVVTPDSVNMISEACATGKPVLTFAPRPIHGKLAAFHATLRERGHLHGLGEPAQPTAPLRETAAIAAGIAARWRERETRR
jgi:mitochondrial fission protein ELM1